MYDFLGTIPQKVICYCIAKHNILDRITWTKSDITILQCFLESPCIIVKAKKGQALLFTHTLFCQLRNCIQMVTSILFGALPSGVIYHITWAAWNIYNITAFLVHCNLSNLADDTPKECLNFQKFCIPKFDTGSLGIDRVHCNML